MSPRIRITDKAFAYIKADHTNIRLRPEWQQLQRDLAARRKNYVVQPLRKVVAK